jgi:5-methylcytosine-specific restriction enzyme subunit McrC
LLSEYGGAQIENAQLPIKKLYSKEEFLKEVFMSEERYDEIRLVCKILVNGVSMLIKRGFNREYISVTDELTVMRGKIDVTETLKRQNYTLGKLSCEFDELSSNILFNQIIKATIITLIKYKELDKKIHQKLINVYRYFEGIQTIKLEKVHFSRIRYHRNNSFYKLIIDICELFYDEVSKLSQGIASTLRGKQSMSENRTYGSYANSK